MRLMIILVFVSQMHAFDVSSFFCVPWYVDWGKENSSGGASESRKGQYEIHNAQRHAKDLKEPLSEGLRATKRGAVVSFLRFLARCGKLVIRADTVQQQKTVLGHDRG